MSNHAGGEVGGAPVTALCSGGRSTGTFLGKAVSAISNNSDATSRNGRKESGKTEKQRKKKITGRKARSVVR